MEESEPRPTFGPDVRPFGRHQKRWRVGGRSRRRCERVGRHVTVRAVVTEKDHRAKADERLERGEPLCERRLVVAEKFEGAGDGEIVGDCEDREDAVLGCVTGNVWLIAERERFDQVVARADLERARRRL